MEWLKRMRARWAGHVYVAPEIVARQVKQEATPPPCTLTVRYRDCWEYGCLGEPDCQYRKASEMDRHLADTGILPGMTKGDW